MQFFLGGNGSIFCFGELVGLAGQRVLPLTYLCDFSQLVTAASYDEADGSAEAITLGYGFVRICTELYGLKGDY